MIRSCTGRLYHPHPWTSRTSVLLVIPNRGCFQTIRIYDFRIPGIADTPHNPITAISLFLIISHHTSISIHSHILSSHILSYLIFPYIPPSHPLTHFIFPPSAIHSYISIISIHSIHISSHTLTHIHNLIIYHNPIHPPIPHLILMPYSSFQIPTTFTPILFIPFLTTITHSKSSKSI